MIYILGWVQIPRSQPEAFPVRVLLLSGPLTYAGFRCSSMSFNVTLMHGTILRHLVCFLALLSIHASNWVAFLSNATCLIRPHMLNGQGLAVLAIVATFTNVGYSEQFGL